MKYVKGSVIVGQRSYKRRLRSGKIREFTKEKYKIITNEKNIFQNQDRIIIMRETDFNDISNLIKDYNRLEVNSNELKSVINDLNSKIKILEEYNRYLEFGNKGNSERNKSNYFTQ